MRASAPADVREFYEASAESYAAIMDSDIDLPVYSDLLGRLAERIAAPPGALVDTSCGPGHLLLHYRERFEQSRPIIGIDLAPSMVALASTTLGPSATVNRGDMRDMSDLKSEAAAAVISFFALHHLDADDAVRAMREGNRILTTDG